MKSSAKKVELASVDDLFSTEESRADAQRERVLEIPLSELHPFKNHPFKVKDDESMMETADSVRQYGVLVPAIARPDPEGGYELVAGHRRHRASELAEKETMPAIVRELDDDAATIIMVDSNLQRESLLPSVRAFAYKMKLEAMKRQAGRPSKNSAQLGRNFDGKESREILAEQIGQSRNQISRYIRLTELIPELLDMPSHDAVSLITVLPEQLQSPLLTAEWEYRLGEIERGELAPEDFMAGISAMLKELVGTYQAIKGTEYLFSPSHEVVGKCPRCGGEVAEMQKGFFCQTESCKFAIWKNNKWWEMKHKQPTKAIVTALLKDGRAHVRGLYSEKTGKTYDATVVLADDGQYANFKLEFDQQKGGKR